MIQEFVSDIDDFIADAQKLKQFVSGPIINIPLNERRGLMLMRCKQQLRDTTGIRG